MTMELDKPLGVWGLTTAKSPAEAAERVRKAYEEIEAQAQAAKEAQAAKLGNKFDQGKPRWSLLPFSSVEQVVNVLTFGAAKYAPDNWKYVGDAKERYSDAALRHITAWLQGEKKDKETGESHLAHAICCLLFLIWFDDKESENQIQVKNRQ